MAKLALFRNLTRSFPLTLLAVMALGLVTTPTQAASGPPAITQQPASQTVIQGGFASFSVVVDGTPPFTYQWFKGTGPIAGATAATYGISGVQPSDEGFYSVAVTNGLGNAMSASAELVVDPGLLVTQTNVLIQATNFWLFDQTSNYDGQPWTTLTFNDDTWSPGLAALYVEDAGISVPKNTPLAIGRNTYYFRTTFDLNTNNYVSVALVAGTWLDDGAVFHLNGQEGLRVGMNPGAVTYNTVAGRTVGDAVPEGPFDFPATNLVSGENVIAVELHQSGAGSSDVVMAMTLDALLTTRTADNQPPTLVGASGSTNNTVLVFFSERVEPATATNAANYAINNGVSILSAAFTNDTRTVVLNTTTLTNEGNYVLTVNNVRDRAVAPNAIAAGTQQPFTVAASAFTTVDIGNPSSSGVYTPATDGFNLTANGTNIYGNADQFSFSFVQDASDFDLRVRVAGLTLSDAWAKAGIMARETTEVGSRYAAVFATPSVAGTFFQTRPTVNGPTTASGQFPVNYPNTWLRLRRAGNVFTGYASVDGQNWSQVGSITLANAVRPILVGLAGVSGTATGTTVAQFREFDDVVGGTIGGVQLAVEPMGPSSRKTGLVISEIMYHPRSNDLEFVEISNADYIPQDISGFRLSGDIAYTFPANTVLPAGGFLVVARNPARLQTVHGISGVLGPWLGEDGSTITNALPDDEGRVRLRNRGDAVILEVNYEGSTPWPLAADGSGHSLVLARPSYGEDDPRAWAASAHIGGSPGRIDPAPVDHLNNVVINEFLANSPTPLLDYIELYNHSSAPVDLSGAWLSDDRDTNKFRIPNGTVLEAREFVSFDEATLGFSLSSGGERIYLVNSNQTRVIDLHAFEAQASGVSSGRTPDGGAAFSELTTRTPGTANSAALTRSIVINEIMYNPLSNDSDDEYVELYNRSGAAVDLSHWRFTDGIDFNFPAGTVIPANSYLVIAKHAAQLRAKHPHLNTTNALGDYNGTLANGGERLAVSMPEFFTVTNGTVITTNANYIVVDEVTYQDGGRWGRWSDGGGSSLELIDADADNRLGPNWADSDETAKAPWTDVAFTGNLFNGPNSPGLAQTGSELHVMIMGGGECLVDNIEVMPPTGTSSTNRVPNHQFASGSIAGWVLQGNHVRTSYSPLSFDGVGGSLHVRATGGGDNGVNRVEMDLMGSPLNAGACTIRARIRWLTGHTNVLLRLYGNYLEVMGDLQIPANLGTPGLANSRAVANAGPAIVDVTHSPILPVANQAVTVTARVSDPDGLSSLQLRYRLDPSATLANVAMNDSGVAGDAVAGDGVFSAILPGQSGGVLAAFHIAAVDGSNVTNTFPNDVPARECHVRFGDPATFGTFGSYRLWMTSANITRWTTRERLSNEPLDATFVYGNFRVIYNAGGRYRGSPWIRPGYNGPTGGRCAYVWTLPEDDTVLGADELNLDSLEPSDRDPTVLREIISFWMAEQLGIPFSHQRFVHVTINGVNNTARGIPIYADSQQPDSSYVQSWFAEQADGEIFKIDDWFEFTDTADPGKEGWNENARLLNYVTTLTNGVPVKNKTRYRWSWEKKFNRVLDDDYTSLFGLADAYDARDSLYATRLESLVDLDEWLTAKALRHVVGDWDGYGYNRGKNQFAYRPNGGKWKMLLWDLDFALGCNGGHPPTQNIFEVEGGETNVVYMYNHPHMRRIYLRALQRAANGPLVDATVRAAIDARYRALQANQVVSVSPYVNSGAQNIPVTSWISQRRQNILSQIPAALFAVTSPAAVTTSNSLITINGTAPVLVKNIRINGRDYVVTWTSVTEWTLRFAVPGDTTLEIVGTDLDGNIITPERVVTVDYTGETPTPETSVVINEIMYNPRVPNASYVEILNNSSRFSFDLSGWRVNGIDFTFPDGSLLTNGQIIVLVKDRTAFAQAYASSQIVFGQFDGSLDNDGETLSLIKPGATPGPDVVIDQVRYEATAPWPTGANGTGASLQLIDATQDNARVSNWSDGAGWRFFTYTGSLTALTNQFLLYLEAVAEIYIDDLMLVAGTVPEAGINLFRNGDFESPLLTSEGGPWEYFNPSGISNTVISTEVKRSGAGSLKLSHRLAGPTARLVQNGVVVPGPGTYTISVWYLPITNNTRLTMRFNNSYRPAPNVAAVLATPGAANSAASVMPAYPPLWLNEVQPNNVTGIQDGSGTAEPWLELYNAGTNRVSLAGMFLADNYGSNLTRWVFPENAGIDPGEFKVIWADGDAEDTSGGEWHTSFRLHPSSGTVALSRPLGTQPQIVDYLTYNNVAPNLSYGDYPDGQPFNRTIFYTVTPGATNEARPGAVFINEWLAENDGSELDNAGDTDDWFELFNPNDYPIDLGGFYLTDNLANKTQFRIPNGYVVPAQGYLLVWADNETQETSVGDLHVNFALRQAGEAIGLYTSDGVLVDGITFGAQTNDVSQGRFPDGAPSFYTMTTRTPEAANIVAGFENTPPVIDALSTRYVTLGRTLSFTATATDPENHDITWSLTAAPLGAAIDANSGSFTWTPTAAQAPSTNLITVRARDNGAPQMSDTKSFTVYVVPPPALAFGKNGTLVTLSFGTVNGQRYRVEYNTLLQETGWTLVDEIVNGNGGNVIVEDQVGTDPQRFYRITLLDN